MKIFIPKLKTDQRGATLIELLVSFVLITLLLTTFLMMFAQSAKTNKSSENILDSTYFAQTEMERIYAKSKSINSSNKTSAFPSSEYEVPVSITKEDTDWFEYKKIKNPSGITIKVRLEDTTDKMSRIIIEVYEDSKANPSAKMENILIWEGT